MITRYTTSSGSVYEVDGDLVRRVVRSEASSAQRVTSEWRGARLISHTGIGSRLVIEWGLGKDEHSPADIPDDAFNVRLTVTTPIVDIVVDHLAQEIA